MTLPCYSHWAKDCDSFLFWETNFAATARCQIFYHHQSFVWLCPLITKVTNNCIGRKPQNSAGKQWLNLFRVFGFAECWSRKASPCSSLPVSRPSAGTPSPSNPLKVTKNQISVCLRCTFTPTGTSLCSLTDETRIPKFFRVTEQVFVFLTSQKNSFEKISCRTASTSPGPPSPPSASSRPSPTTRPARVKARPRPPTSSWSTSPSSLSSTITSLTGGWYTGAGLFTDHNLCLEKVSSKKMCFRQIGAEGGKGNNMFYKVLSS